MISDEKVVVIRNSLINSYFLPLGGEFSESSICCGLSLSHLMDNIYNNLELKPRGKVEGNSAYRQVIPYQVVLQPRSFLAQEVFLFQRTKKQGESRLHGKWSIGVGGHVNQEDMFTFNRPTMFHVSMDRELKEETPAIVRKRELVAAIRSDTDPVNSVHLCLLYYVSIAHGSLEVAERDKIHKERWIGNIKELRKCGIYDQLETWSKIAAHLTLPLE